MNTNKMMFIGISFVLVGLLLSSGNALNLSFAQSIIPNQPSTVNQTNEDDNEQTNTGGDNNNSDQQNYDDFQSCLEEEAGISGFAAEQQIRDCFAPIYVGGNNDDNGNDDNGNDDDN